MAWRGLVIVILAGWVAGTGCADGYADGRSEAAIITPRRTWRASGDMRTVYAAVDQDLSTAAVSAEPGGRGTVTIDLGKPCLFNMIFIEHGPNDMGFARRVAVLTSMDGEVFTQQYAGPGTRRVTVLYLGAPVLARYVRLRAVVAGDRPWSVAEVYLY